MKAERTSFRAVDKEGYEIMIRKAGILTMVIGVMLLINSCELTPLKSEQEIPPQPSPSPTIKPSPTFNQMPISPTVHFIEIRVNGITCDFNGEEFDYVLDCDISPHNTVQVFAEVDDDSEGNLHFMGTDFWYLPHAEAVLSATIPYNHEWDMLFFDVQAEDGETADYNLHYTPGPGFPPKITIEDPTGLTGDVVLDIRIIDLSGEHAIQELSVEQVFNLQTDNKRITQYISNQDLSPFEVEEIGSGSWQVSFTAKWPGRFPLEITATDANGKTYIERIPVEIYWAEQPLDIKGVMVEGWAEENPSSLGTSDFVSVLDNLKELNANYISVSAIWALSDANDSTFEREPPRWTSGHNFSSLKDDQLAELIQLAHERGMGVMVKPMVFVRDWTWIGSIVPIDPDEWFQNYQRQVLLPMAELATEYDAEMLVLFNDSSEQNRYKSIWIELIDEVRQIYDGEVTLASSQFPADVYEPVSFADHLDVYGAQSYLVGSGTRSLAANGIMDPTVDYMHRRFALVHDAKKFALESNDLELVLTELGVSNVDGVNQLPWEGGEGSVDNQERVDYMEASLRAISERPWIRGAFLWAVTPSSSIHISSRGITHDIRFDPIDDLIRIWFYDVNDRSDAP